jgi:hypothetical protein
MQHRPQETPSCIHATLGLAKQMGQALPDAEEREIFEATFCRVPVSA